MATFSFPNFPAGWKLPLHWVDIDPSQAGTRQTGRLAALLVGHKNSSGAGALNIARPVASQAMVDREAGVGSMLSRMVSTFLANNRTQELWILPVAEPSGGVAAAGDIVFTAAPTAAGTISLYIAGQLVQVAVTATDTAITTAAKVVAAINAVPSMPVTASQPASPNDHKAHLVADWTGLTGNDIDIAFNVRGRGAKESLPYGLAATITFMTGGTGAPDFATAISNLGDAPFEFVALPFSDTTSTSVWETEYGFSDSGRWGWLRENYGHLFSAKRDTYSGHLLAGPSDNAGVLSTLAIEGRATAPCWEYAAAYCAQAARALSNDPARPLQSLVLRGILAPLRNYRFLRTQTNNLAGVGWAISEASADGTVRITRESTRYQVNDYGQPDNAYDLVTTLATLATLFRRQKQAITDKFPRHKLADNGTRFSPGQAMVTPNAIKAELVAQYAADMYEGLVENMAAFKANLRVERDSDDPNRVNVLYAPDIVNQLRIFAVLGQFRLQYTEQDDIEALRSGVAA
jgi:phage tail sheath gpL-like